MTGQRCEHCLRVRRVTFCPKCHYDGVPQNRTPALPEGTRLNNRYMLGREEGRGGFSICYRAWDEHRNEIVAIKELFPVAAAMRYSDDHVTVPPGQRANFDRAMIGMRREALVLQKLVAMPAVVQVRDYFEANGTVYLVAGFLRGQPYNEYLSAKYDERGWHLPVAAAVNVARHISGVLEAVHRQQLHHLDVKPPNIRVLDDNRFVLLDFGSARDAFRQGGEGSFTPGFAAQEQSDASAPTTPATDVHGLAATLYYSLCRRPPAPADERAEGEPLVSMRTYNPDVPEALDEIVQKALSLDPFERYATPALFAKALAPFAQLTDPYRPPEPGPEPEGESNGERTTVSAPLWQRLVAGMLDGFIFCVLTAALLLVGLVDPDAPGDWLFDLLCGGIVLILTQHFLLGTPGMRLLKLRVQARHGEPTTLIRLTARTILSFCLGPILLATGNNEGLLWHDRVTSTRICAS